MQSFIFVQECGKVLNSNNLARIMGGQDAIPHSWPSSVLIIFKYSKKVNSSNGSPIVISQKSICGGTLIDRFTVITAANVILKRFS